MATHCEICGDELPPPKSKRGRPRVFCGDDCKNFDALRRRMTSYADKVSAKLSARYHAADTDAERQVVKDKIKDHRSHFWHVANTFNMKKRT